MQDSFNDESVRNRLILAGLKELESRGVKEFSVRRVAEECGVSCAAPYRHFKDKEAFISDIILYVMDGWKLLSDQISDVFKDDKASLVAELALAGLRFWIANGNFRTVLMNTSKGGAASSMRDFDRPIIEAVRAYCTDHPEKDADVLIFKVITMLYGAVVLVDEGYDSADHAAENLKTIIYAQM